MAQKKETSLQAGLTARPNLFRKAMDGCADPLVIYDRTGRAVYINSSFERVFGWTAEELIGQRINFVPQQSRHQTKYAIQKVLNGQVILGMETVRNTKAQGEIHVRLSANAFWDEKKEFDGMIVTLQDISDLIYSRQTAEQANHTKQNFLSNISHEIRTPMNGLMGILELLDNTRLDDEQHEYVSVLKKSAKTLMTVINDILDFSRIETGTVKCRIIDFDLRTLLDALPDDIDKKASQKGVTVSFSVDAKVPSLLQGDPEKIRQILEHLLNNAIKFTPKGDVGLTISAIRETPTHVSLSIAVSDTGIGIEPDMLKTIFDSFSQADSSSTRKYGGIGIGLSLSNRLVSLMDGTIDVSSTPGKGSVFTIVLTLAKQAPLELNALHRPDNIKGKKVLLVDSDDASRLILKESFSHWGCRVSEAISYQRALEKISSDTKAGASFDILLIDMHLSDGSGEKLAKNVRASRDSDVMIIMLSRQGKPGDVERLEKIGVQGYLPKPVDHGLLFECITTGMALIGAGVSKVLTRHFLREHRKQQVHILLTGMQSSTGKKVENILVRSGYWVEICGNIDQAMELFESGRYNMALVADDQINDQADESFAGMIAKMRKVRQDNDIGKIIILGLVQNEDPKDDLGMVDDYIVQPVTAEKLLSMVEQWMNRIRVAEKQVNQYSDVIRTGKRKGVFNFEAALERAMDDREFLEEVLGEYIKSLSSQLETMKTAIVEKDGDLLSLSANALKGSSANIGAEQMSLAARELEKVSDIGDFESASRVFHQLEKDSRVFNDHINHIDWSDI